MKKILCVGLSLLCFTISIAQQPFAGIRSSSYLGVQNVVSNPADIVDSQRKWDVNLISISTILGYNQSLKIKDLNKDNIFNSNKGNFSGVVNVDVLGPSFMFSLNKSNAIAFFSRTRVFANASGLEPALFNGDTDYTLPTTGTSQRLSLNAWSEIGGTWSHVFLQNEKHTIKAGVTVKYLRGLSNIYAGINGLNGARIVIRNNDAFLVNALGSVEIINSGIDFTDFKTDELSKSYASSIGFDMGISYQKNLEDEKWCDNCGTRGNYRYKIGLSVMDLGRLKYTPIANKAYSYSLNIPDNTNDGLNLDSLGDNIDEIQNNLVRNQGVTRIDVSGNYKVSLPTTINIMADYYFGSGFFVEVAGTLNTVNSKNTSRNPYYNNSVTATPRFENKFFGAYLPVNYNEIMKFNAGIAFRLGPVYFGSQSVLSSLTMGSKLLDFYFGIRFGR